MLRLFCLCSGAGEVLADRLLSLHSVEKLHIRDIDPAPVLRVLSEDAECCTVSTLGVAFRDNPELVRSVSLGPWTLKAHLYTLCVHGCTQAHVADLLLYILYYDIIGQCVIVRMCWSRVYCTVSFDWL